MEIKEIEAALIALIDSGQVYEIRDIFKKVSREILNRSDIDHDLSGFVSRDEAPFLAIEMLLRD